FSPQAAPFRLRLSPQDHLQRKLRRRLLKELVTPRNEFWPNLVPLAGSRFCSSQLCSPNSRLQRRGEETAVQVIHQAPEP
ncbi:hypothetical protein CCMA1212_008501, partial [Trichoderma ghanense]